MNIPRITKKYNELQYTDEIIYITLTNPPMSDFSSYSDYQLDGTAEEALRQIDAKGYAIQYEAGDKKIVKVGVNIEKDRRTIERWVVGE